MKKRPTHILSIPFEHTTSFLQGTNRAPEQILPHLHGDRFPFVTEVCSPDEQDPVRVEAAAYDGATRILQSGGFPLAIGGEHTVSVGLIRAAAARPIGIVQLDAHSDLRDSYEGSKWSHASVMRRAVEGGLPLLGIGIRAMCEEEALYVKSRTDIYHVGGRAAARATEWYRLLDLLPADVYLTLDMDVLDPVEMPAVGTPEPGGMSISGLHRFLRHLFAHKNVVGADVVELMPRSGDDTSVAETVRLVETLDHLHQAFG